MGDLIISDSAQTCAPSIPGMAMEPGISPDTPLGRLLGISTKLMNGLWFCPAIPPNLCEEIAEESTAHNRKRESRHSSLIAAVMRDGRWRKNIGCDIHFHVDGWLANGQHRLHGAKLADVPFYALIHTGLSNRDIAALDLQRKRTSGDVLRIAFGDMDNVTLRTSVANAILQYESGDLTFNRKFDPYEISELAYNIKEEDMDILRKVVNASLRIGLCNCIAGALLLIVARKYRDKAVMFVDQIDKGLQLEEGSPAWLYRSYMLKAKDTRKGARWKRHDFAKVTISALNLLTAGKKAPYLSVPHKGDPKVALECWPVTGKSKKMQGGLMDIVR